jgi:hypothetical protein
MDFPSLEKLTMSVDTFGRKGIGPSASEWNLNISPRIICARAKIARPSRLGSGPR